MVDIRPEQPGDSDAIRTVHLAAFPAPDEANLVDALRAARRLVVSLVAVKGEQILGHIAFSPVSCEGTEHALGLAPVAVLPDQQRQGIGSGLIREGLAVCGRIRAPFVVVLGDPAYYARFGFAPANHWGIFDEYGGGSAFQAIELQPGAIPQGTGLAKYAPEFACVSGSPDD